MRRNDSFVGGMGGVRHGRFGGDGIFDVREKLVLGMDPTCHGVNNPPLDYFGTWSSQQTNDSGAENQNKHAAGVTKRK